MKTRLILFFTLCFFSAAYSQPSGTDLTHFVNGYERKISGTDYMYHSSIPDVKESLITRATDGKFAMEWETAPVKIKPGEKKVTVVWLAGIGSSPGKALFHVDINSRRKFTFTADGSDHWTQDAPDGSSLSFQSEMTDEFGDKFGYLFLELPVTMVTAGKPLVIRVTGGNQNRTSWYMTYKFPLKSGLSIRALPAIVEKGGKKYQAGKAGILHLGRPAMVRIFIGDRLVRETMLKFGYNYVDAEWPAVDKPGKIGYRLELPDSRQEGTLELKPIRHWRINFVQHSHTDIGYTRPQTEVLGEHLRYIDYALDYCDLTDTLPDAARFRWTCEASWAVDEYLKCRPAAQVERLMKRIREGRIELTGMYFNFDELPDEQILAASLQPLGRFRKAGLEIKTAMQNDVNGIGWCLNDFYSGLGIKYLNMGTHGHRALICFDKPTLFWWESPAGNKMLAYRAEHYMLGNTLFKIHAGDFNRFENEVLTYLTSLEQKGYPYDLVSIQHSGYLTDNSPPSTLASGMIRRWNEKYAWPRLSTATATSFFEEMEQAHGSEFPVIRGAWPDWWTDGFGASAREVAAVREAQTDFIANTSGLTMALLMGARLPEKTVERMEAINSALLFYTEHTVGYHQSVRDPFGYNTMLQRAIKESYAWEAARRAKMIGEETMGLLQQYAGREKEPALMVYNTLNWKRSGLVRVYIDHQIIPRYASFTITDDNGHLAPAQQEESFSDGAYWALWVDDIPAFGFRKYRIKINREMPQKEELQASERRSGFENQWYNIRVDTLKAAISGLYDKQLDREWVDQGAEWKPGEFIYEVLANRQQMEAFKLDNYTRVPLEKVWFEGFSRGPVWNTFRFTGNTKAASKEKGFQLEIRVFNTSRRIDLVYSIEKKMVTDPEGIYIAFPMKLEKGELSFDVQGGEVRAGVDQIPGSSNDWNTVQHYARLSNPEAQLVITSPEAPLMQFGAINTGRYKAGAVPASTHLYGWPMNNYWTTNFNGEQHGGHAWRYSLTSIKSGGKQEAVRTGWGNRVPFLVRVLPGGGTGDAITEKSLLTGWPENILLVSALPEEEGKSAVFQVRETAGRSVLFSLSAGETGAPLKILPVDVTGAPLENGNLTLKPYESRFFRVSF